MRLEVATAQDEAELRRFFEQFSLNSIVDLRMRRPQDFFAPYRTQSDDTETLVLREDDGSLAGIGTYIYRHTFYEDRVQKIALATDLRVLPTRRAIMSWSHHFLPLLRETIKAKGVGFVFSVINSQDKAAFNTFVRPRQMRRPMPRYHLYRKFQLVTLHGRFPWAPKPLSGLKIRRGDRNTIGSLLEYLKRRAPYRAFTSVWDEVSFLQKMARLPNFVIEDFWIATDSQNQIVGCVAPWSPRQVQQYCPISYSLRAHNFRQFLKFGKALGWTRPLTKPTTRTGAEIPLKFRFLSFVTVDNEDIFESLLWEAFNHLPKDEFLVYGHCQQDFRLSPPRSWVHATMPFGLYSVLPPEMDRPNFLHPTQTLNPEIEPCYFF